MKERLFNPLAHEFARRECAIHAKMKHENIAKLYDYSESASEYELYMEYADKGDYLCRKILDVSCPSNIANYLVLGAYTH